MTASETPQNTDSTHRIAAAPGKTDRILPADALACPKPKLPDQLREGRVSHLDPAAIWPVTVLTQVVKKITYAFYRLLPMTNRGFEKEGGDLLCGMT